MLSEQNVVVVHQLLALLHEALCCLPHSLHLQSQFRRKLRAAIEVRADVLSEVLPTSPHFHAVHEGGMVTSTAMALADKLMDVFAEALPQVRRTSLVAAGNEPSTWEPLENRPSGNAERPQHARGSVRLEAVKVLVVDDDSASLDYFAFALETCGAVVSVAMSAREALELIPQVLPNVILSDIAMPDEDGYWLLNEVRRHVDRGVRGLPVVAATAYGRNYPRAQVLAAGFHEHLAKPVDPDLLCQVIASAVGR